ncbi:MAG: phosphatidylinositol transfer protein [Polyangiaceae bacterium]|nr:phosphatidylinositol transfer protein [Polyangiaceae bacterium]
MIHATPRSRHASLLRPRARGLGLAASCLLALASACTSGQSSGPDGTGGAGTGATGAGGGGASTSSSTSTTSTSTSSTTGNGGAGGTSCAPPPACDAAPPDPGAAQPWNDPLTPILVTSQGAARHRVRDLFLNPGDPQWVLAKLAYGALDKDLVGEWVDIYLLRDCAASWELLGSALTTNDGDHVSVEGVDDTGGRVFFPIPAGAALGAGRHRLHVVVRGDLTSADGFIEVVPAGTPLFVTDVDGTLTTYETEEFVVLLTGNLPEPNPSSAEALALLADKGIRPFYLTARPEWLDGRTREFLAANGYPPGIVHTSLSFTGALGNAAETYKTDELARVLARGLALRYAFGNTATDAAAYANSGVSPLDHRVFFQFDDPQGGRRIESYAELLGELAALPPECP